MRKTVLPAILILVLASVACLLIADKYSKIKHDKNPYLNKTEQKEAENTSEEDDSPVVSGKRLTAEDICIVVGSNAKESQITLRNIKGGDDKVLNYDGKTIFSTKNDGPLSASEIEAGDIVDISFTTYDKKLQTVKQSASAWENTNVNKFTIDDRGKSITIGDELYKMADTAVIASGDQPGKLLDVTSLDTITVKGIDKEVYSIKIDKGHGYIRVTNDSYFVGGWIEIGQDIITILTESMLIPVPEGNYDVKITNKGYVGRENLDVERDKETKLDLSKIDIEEVAIGHVQFDITPDYAQLFVDGIMTDFTERVPLEYGIHSVRAELAGYETVRANIRVGSEMANISIELDESLDSDTDSGSGSKKPDGNDPSYVDNVSSIASGNTDSNAVATDTTNTILSGTTSEPAPQSSANSNSVISDNKKIYIEGPTGAEVYLDGAYVGIAPCDTQKVTGTHTITLTKSGYETKSYTISVSNDGKDLTMSFSELSATQ